jgi:hypothetical protein
VVLTAAAKTSIPVVAEEVNQAQTPLQEMERAAIE